MEHERNGIELEVMRIGSTLASLKSSLKMLEAMHQKVIRNSQMAANEKEKESFVRDVTGDFKSYIRAKGQTIREAQV